MNAKIKTKKPKSLLRLYIEFIVALKEEFSYTCQMCNKKNFKNKESDVPFDKIVCHHIRPVKYYGVLSPLLMDKTNLIVVCQFCHFIKCHRYSLKMAIHCATSIGGAVQRQRALITASNVNDFDGI
jgi:hypothetical protein